MTKGITFTGRQIAAARELLGIDQKELAAAAGISAPTLRRMELSTGIPGGILNNLLAVQRALEDAGVVFTGADKDGGAGVRLKAVESDEGLTHKINTLEADLAKTASEPPKTPKGGMQRLERAHKREAVTKLKNRRTKLAKAKK
jgi:transcriptional regulator with XRE-family HTH domain